MGFNYLSIVLGAHEEPAFQSSNDREEVQITFKALEDLRFESAGATRVLIVAAITKWRIVPANHDALNLYASHPDADLTSEIKDPLEDRSFYEGLKKLRELLQPVDCNIRQSEGMRASLCDVSERWDKIWSSEPMIVPPVNLKKSARVSATCQTDGQDLDEFAVYGPELA
ncbi:hypothetical protein E4U28_002344 [Claviceps purpurea]|nr:hypothetical protein E4U28_002344 [Claviceps purpurea]